MLCGTIRDHVTKKRRGFLRYFGCQQDLSFVDTAAPLPELIVAGAEPFIIRGALSGAETTDAVSHRCASFAPQVASPRKSSFLARLRLKTESASKFILPNELCSLGLTAKTLPLVEEILTTGSR